jgi:hypothetical protein
MKSLLAFALAASAIVVSVPAAADPTAPGTLVLPTRTIYGRLDKPKVVIVVKTPTAASQAGEAHEGLRAALMKQYEPATLHPAP